MQQQKLFDDQKEYSTQELKKITLNYLTDRKENLFIIFWDKYKRKVAYTAARKAFMKLDFREIEKVLERVDDYVLSTPDKKYRCHAATWLNQKRYLDEIEVPKTKEQEQDDVFKKIIESRIKNKANHHE